MKLVVPPEPIELKAWMSSLQHSHFEETGGEDNSASIVWSGNKLPKYLWDKLKVPLKAKGLTWQTFMSVLRHRTDICVLWYKGSLPWNDFISSLESLIDSPIGKKPKDKKDGIDTKPMDLAQWQVPPPRDWDKFERICSDLWSKIWTDNNLQRFGRLGQTQYGIDIFGVIKSSGNLAAVQCKKKDATSPDDVLTEKEIQTIVNEAKKFPQPLTEFVIAYTGKRDGKLQAAALRISKENKALGLFSVHLFSWDDILEKMGDYGEVFTKHFPEFSSLNVDPLKSADVLERFDNLDQKADKTYGLLTESIASASVEKESIAQKVFDQTAISGEHSAEIDVARDMIDNLKPKEAFDYLEALEKRIWPNANNMARFRILTNKAAALSSLKRENESAKLFIQAHQYNPEDEKALCNRAIGHIIFEQIDEAKIYLQKVLDINPMSSRAHGLMISCYPLTDSMEKIVQEIPVTLRKTEDIAFGLANAARQRGDLISSAHWLEVALEDSSKTRIKNPEIRATLASTILESFMSKHEVVNGIQLTIEDREKINRAIALLTEAIDQFSQSESINYRATWFANRATAYKLVGETDKAEADMAKAVQMESEDPVMLKQHAFMLYAKGDHKPATEILNKLIGNKEVPEAAYILAGIFFEQGKLDESAELIVKSFEQDLPSDLKAEEERMLVHIYMRQKKYDEARKLSLLMRSSDPTSIAHLTAAARLERMDEKKEVAEQLLNEANGYVNDQTPAHIAIELAEEFFKLGKYNDAWPLYEKIIDPRISSSFLDNLLYSYYRSNQFDKAIDIYKQIPQENKTIFLLEIELSILEGIGDVKAAAESAELYLSTHEDSPEIRVRLATLWFRLDEFQKLDQFLSEEMDIANLPLNPGFQLAAMYSERGMLEKALKTAYELRRLHFEVGEAHTKYISLFLTEDSKISPLVVTPKKSDTSTAISVKGEIGDPRWYVLEDRDQILSALSEISISEDLGGKLLGKTVGDSIVISEGIMGTNSITVVDLKNKYIHALHESMRIVPERFSHLKGFEPFVVDTSNEQKTKESFEKVMGVVSKRGEHVSQVEQFYKDTKLTVGAFAIMIGTNIADVWFGLGNTKTGIKSCVGTLEERNNALALIKHSKTVAVDITALLTIAQHDLFSIVEKSFDKIMVTQSTIDALQEIISSKKGLASKGYTTIGKEDEGFIREEITGDQVAKNTALLEKLKKWIRESCAVTPCKTLHTLSNHEEMQKILGRDFLETILIAKEYSSPLFSEDLATRALASSDDFKVTGFWTQIVLINALYEKKITLKEYDEHVVKLILGNYHHTTIGSTAVIEAARQAGWKNEYPLTGILNTLRGSKMEIGSATGVLVDFLYRLWHEPMSDSERENLVTVVLDVLTDERDAKIVVQFVRSAIKMRFSQLPLAESRIKQVISAWEILNKKNI